MFLDYDNLEPLFLAIHSALCSVMPEGLAIFLEGLVVFWKKCKQINVAMIGNSPSDTILFLYFNISFIICLDFFYRCNKVLFRIVHL